MDRDPVMAYNSQQTGQNYLERGVLMRVRVSFPGLLTLAALLSLGAAACGGQGGNAVELAPASALPPEVRAAPQGVQQAYRFALANADLLQQIPCYCGCGAMGHGSNYDCYVESVAADGTVEFETHALG